MIITISLSTHVYQDDKLVDNIYLDDSLPDSAENCGIHGPEVILPLRKNHSIDFCYEYDDTTTLDDVDRYIKNYIGLPEGYGRTAFFHSSLRYWIYDGTANFSHIINKHLDPSHFGTVYVGLYVSMNAGVIDEVDGLRYYMNSGEQGKHHEPHVHVCDTSRTHSATIQIRNGKAKGNLNPRLLKKT